MTLKEEISQATLLVQNYTDLQKQDNQIKQYTNLLERIEELKPITKNIVQSFTALHQRSPGSFAKFQSLATRQLRQIKNDLQAGNYPIQQIKGVKNTLSEQEVTLQAAWKNYVYQLSSSTENTLGLIGSLKDNPARITEINTRLSNLRKQWPVTDRHLELLDKAIADGHNVLTVLSLDNEIEEFIFRLIQREARLSDLNMNIINWLNDKDIAKKLVISIESE